MRTPSGTYADPEHSTSMIGTSSTSVIGTNGARQYLLIVNDSDATVYVSLGNTAAMNQGIRLNPGGGSFEMSAGIGNLYRGSISAISSGPGKVLLITEGT